MLMGKHASVYVFLVQCSIEESKLDARFTCVSISVFPLYLKNKIKIE